MSDIMLHGVLNMPPELWNDQSPIDVMQRHSRYVQASQYINELKALLIKDQGAVTISRNGYIEELECKLEEHKLALERVREQLDTIIAAQ